MHDNDRSDHDRPDLQINENLEHQRASWAIERVGWGVWAVILICAVLGLFGRGLLGTATAVSTDGTVTVEYPRFWRMQSPMTLRVRVNPRAQDVDEVRVWLDGAYLDSNSVAAVVPEPAGVESSGDRITYELTIDATRGPPRITLELEPQRPGLRAGRVGLEGGSEVAFRQFIYP